MDQITHREMRNQSGEILRKVEAGESIHVSNNGRLAATISPAGGDVLDGLIARGEARPARVPFASLLSITRGTSELASEQLIDDIRRRW